MDNFLNLLNPELAVIIPFLAILGKILKDLIKVLDNSYIPAILGLVSIVMCALYFMAFDGNTPILQLIFNAIVQGILNAAVAVYGHQLVTNLTHKE